jgi:hypothetical protein
MLGLTLETALALHYLGSKRSVMTVQLNTAALDRWYFEV